MKTLSEYLTPVPDGYQPQAVIHLSGEFDSLLELQYVVDVAIAEDWRSLLLLDSDEQFLGVIGTNDLENDILDEAAQSRQMGALSGYQFVIPLPIIYICPHDPNHPRHLLVKRGPPPLCRECGKPCEEWQIQEAQDA